ncbi:hypothetical protein K2173_027733 [Erythroxylum novogranatense]|uniref:Homeobox domain-containing protein n=1 Tax=Erythroxylum novogranatense TaxID=1862640 RepID=A0AAV8TZW2_9ROSI|nr:hypothetical protein K2173_027733 [Erythroxylum novogranatense]
MATYCSGLSDQKDNFQEQYQVDQKQISYSNLQSEFSNLTNYIDQSPTVGSYFEIQNCEEFPPHGTKSEMMFIPPTSHTNLHSIDRQFNMETGDAAENHVSGSSQVISRTDMGILDGEPIGQSQGLSLSLSTQMPPAVSVPSFQYQNQNLILPSALSSHVHVLEKWIGGDANNQSADLRDSESVSSFAGGNQNYVKAEASHSSQWLLSHDGLHMNKYMHDPTSYVSTTTNIFNSKYIKSARELLDEVVSMKKAVKKSESNKCLDDSKETDGRLSSQSILPTSSGMSLDPSDSNANSCAELSPAERQDTQNKKTKLLSMLDEVDRRYKHYFHQMQIVVSSFDMVAGHGAAKSYTALALQTISRHFRSLRDAISGQIEEAKKRLGDPDASMTDQKGIPRLRYVDHHLRQQRALQQMGVIRHTWRPQRGLPESSVSVLRAWLFEHFLHPYPNDSEKLTLARKTGLTRNQVANWFINARVRLWKPMVEEMYKEEFGELEANSQFSLDDPSKAQGENDLASDDRLDELRESVVSTADNFPSNQVHDLKSHEILDSETNIPIARTLLPNDHDGANITDFGIMKFQQDQMSKVDDQSLYNQNGDRNLMSSSVLCDMSEWSSYTPGNQVSLALRLQQNGSDSFPESKETHILDSGMADSSAGLDAVDYHPMNVGKQQDRFGNSHMFHDFVV